jgi:DNA-binding winged helix-turn-helix (wHTH) protein
MSHALKLATLIPETESPRSKDRKVPPFVGSRTPFGRLQLADAPVLERFNPDPGFGVRGRVQSPDTDPLKPSKPAGATTSEVSFGPFRLLPAQFLLLEGDKPVPLGSRAMHILIVLLERPGELVSKQELMAQVWPNLFVEPANLTVHVSALRRALRDGRDGNRFIINIPGRGYIFVASIKISGHEN